MKKRNPTSAEWRIKNLNRKLQLIELKYNFAIEDGKKLVAKQLVKQAEKAIAQLKQAKAQLRHEYDMAHEEAKEINDGMVQRDTTGG